MARGDLALFGGCGAVSEGGEDPQVWPIIGREDEDAVLGVLRRGAMSANDVSLVFENELAGYFGVRSALTFPNGTESLRSALWALGVAAGDEVICPSMTYWASCAGALTLGAAVNFADCDSKTLCIDPGDIEHRIGPRTKVVIAVHYGAHPCDMDPILAIARRHGVKVLEDVSHAQGGLYKGRKLGSLGDAAGLSLMSGKSLVAGECGALLTNNRQVYERAVAYGFYERTGAGARWTGAVAEPFVTDPELLPYAGLPLGGVKHRVNQLASALGRAQLRRYPERMAEIDQAMRHFCDRLDVMPGLRCIRVGGKDGSTMGGWYAAHVAYDPAAFGGAPVARFCEAVAAEGVLGVNPGANMPLHTHPLFHTADIFGQGKPTMVAFGQRDVRQGPGSLPATERANETTFSLPWFKRLVPEVMDQYIAAFRKVADNAAVLTQGISEGH